MAITLSAVILLATITLQDDAVVSVAVDPPVIRLTGPTDRHLILVDGSTFSGQTVDLTGSAKFRSIAPTVATVDTHGFVRPAGDGQTTIVVEAGGHSRNVEVVVEVACQPRKFDFENDIMPVLSKLGCNSSGCHGKAEVQNGFKLSVFGFDPAADHAALTKEGRGRRVFPAAPKHSLLLTKAVGSVPHGGGGRTSVGSED